MRHHLRKVWLLAVAGVALAACEENFVEEKTTQSFTTGPSPKVLVETHNGSIHVRVGRRIQGVTATVVKRGYGKDDKAAQESLGTLVTSANQTGEEVHLGADAGDSKLHNAASYFVEVPAGASLDLRSVNGCIEVLNVQGDITARTTNACINAQGVSGRVELHTTNGEITLVPDGAVVNAQTTNGDISLNGWLGAGLNTLGTTNGSVDVVLPADATFALDANTTNGHVGTDFSINSGLHNRGTSLQGNVGDNPATQLVINTTNGSISVNKGQ